MTNKEMVDKWLLSRGMTRTSGDGIDPVAPFFMLDIAWNLWNKTVTPLRCKFEMKRIKTMFAEKYKLFSKQFIDAFTLDESIEVTDKMDDLEAYIANHMTVAKVQVMNYLTGISTEQKMVCGSLMIVNILIQSAGILWAAVYKGLHSYESTSLEIAVLERLSTRFMNGYHSAISSEAVDPNRCQPIIDSVTILCKKMVAWLNKESKRGE